jgi:hypothetical protein
VKIGATEVQKNISGQSHRGIKISKKKQIPNSKKKTERGRAWGELNLKRLSQVTFVANSFHHKICIYRFKAGWQIYVRNFLFG